MRITITEISKKATKTNVPFWSVKDSQGNSMTVWDEVIAADIEKHLNYECEAEIKVNGKFSNIRSFDSSNASEVIKVADNGPTGVSVGSSRENSIIAQCLVKAVFYQPVNFANEFKGIEDAVEMYKKAVSMLENE